MEIVEPPSSIPKAYKYPASGWVLVRVRAARTTEEIGKGFVPDGFGPVQRQLQDN
jgi:hypothetical protein